MPDLKLIVILIFYGKYENESEGMSKEHIACLVINRQKHRDIKFYNKNIVALCLTFFTYLLNQ